MTVFIFSDKYETTYLVRAESKSEAGELAGERSPFESLHYIGTVDDISNGEVEKI